MGEEEGGGEVDSLEVEDVVVEDAVVSEGLLLVTPLRKTITLMKTKTPVKRTTMALTMTTMTMTMTTTTDVIEVVVSEGLLVDVRTVPAPPVRTTKDLSVLMEADLTMGNAKTQVQRRALMGLLLSVQMAAPQLQSQCVQTTLMWSFSELRGEFWPMATDHFQRLADNWRFQQNVIMTSIEIEMSYSICC